MILHLLPAVRECMPIVELLDLFLADPLQQIRKVDRRVVSSDVNIVVPLS